MAIDPVQLVKNQLSVLFELDSSIESVIDGQVEAEIARQGWGVNELTDQRAVYIADWATYALLPRIILKFSQELSKARGGPAEVEYQNAIEGLKVLMAQLRDKINSTAKKIDPAEATPVEDLARWPSTGILSI